MLKRLNINKPCRGMASNAIAAIPANAATPTLLYITYILVAHWIGIIQRK